MKTKKKKRKRNESFIKLFCFFVISFFSFLLSFHFSWLFQNNLTGTIPTQIGLMASLQILWEPKRKKKERNETFIKIWSIFLTFFICFYFYFSYLDQNNLNGTIPTEIGLMKSLGWLWEPKKKRNEMNSFKFDLFFYLFIFFFIFLFSFYFSFLSQNNLNGTIPSQIGLITSLTRLWEQKKKENEPFIRICFILLSLFWFVLVIFIKIIWLEQFQLKLDWRLHWYNCENKKKRKSNHKIFIFFIFINSLGLFLLN